MNRTALTVGRYQPLHSGHLLVINKMCQDFETVIVCVGSTNVHDKNNPWSFEDRKQMLRNIYSDRIKIVQLADIGSQKGTTDWVDYVLDKLKKLGLPYPTDYVTGSKADSVWYSSRFSLNFSLDDLKLDYYIMNPITDITDPAYTPPYESNGHYIQLSKPAVENNIKGYYTAKRCLHIVDRDQNDIPPATDLRTYLELGEQGWQEWVPKVNHDIVLDNYPKEFILKNEKD